MLRCKMNSYLLNEYSHYIGKKCFNDIYAISRFMEGAKKEISNIIVNIDNADIIIFGDSVLNFSGPFEDHTSVPRFLSANCKGKIYNFSAGSFSFLLFNRFFKHYGSQFKDALKGKVVLFEINPRSFSDEWFLRPSYQFEHVEGFLNNDQIQVAKDIFTNSLNLKTENFYDFPLSSDILSFKQFETFKTIREVFGYFKLNPKIYEHQFDFYYGYSFSKLKKKVFRI